jgi:uncharacterized protein YndB with AHSA1/START domain
MDVRPGGAWRLTMYAGPGGREIRWAGEYLEVQPPRRLRFTVTDRPEEDRFELVTVVLSELDQNRTEMLFEQRGHMAVAEYRRAQSGWSSFFDRVDARLRAPA